ncbi:spermidine/putrescine transport system ATP-binding protein [Tepidamorphus gemmatus]|uniref:Spermidine/putrescine import ATP-binding protein PotA n=1 Tax=Tepidamorphus gemmatus TaxID=747076 RepID=A0A4R3LRT4_9HYPH|nr:ABC transporter ATP-binding protein [Tepidamorphus gemmatus]TCT03130.1 spermidine/putrescine transport system ATP-binding protein [Tepidamorphus gemmatus]
MSEHIAEKEAIGIRNAVKRYGGFTALKGVTLSIADNEFFTLLGPSGCGKTTLLRIIAGFEAVSEGEIVLYGERIAHLPPDKRPVNTVFQHYALFPHMSVFDNVAFGLRRLRKSPGEVEATVRRMLELVHLQDFADRLPGQLSGGQQQRVALARALAPHPRVLLLDEPLSALDLKLRQAMRSELLRLQRDTGITFVFVTHDQEEALAMSDRIAVLQAGEVQQVGTPEDIYLRPRNRFVADFIGDTNFIEARVERVFDGAVELTIDNGIPVRARLSHRVAPGEMVTLSLRPENIVITAPDAGLAEARVLEQTFLGPNSLVTLELPGGTRLHWRRSNQSGSGQGLSPGERVGVRFAEDAIAMLTS